MSRPNRLEPTPVVPYRSSMPTTLKHDPTAWHGVMHPSGLTLEERYAAVLEHTTLYPDALTTPPKQRRRRAVHLPGLAPYAALLAAILLVVTASGSRLADYSLHALIGVVGVLCGIAGRRACQHRHHQVAVAVTLLLIEAYASVQLVG